MKQATLMIFLILSFSFLLTANGRGETANNSYEPGQGYGRLTPWSSDSAAQPAEGFAGSGRGQGRGRNEADENGTGTKGYGSYENYANNQGFEDDFLQAIHPVLENIDPGNLSIEEERGLILLREEEKLARDVYDALYTVWNLPIFANIGRSEAQHMESVGLLIDAYGIDDPIKTDTAGVFMSPELQQLYDDLVAKGSVSLLAALQAGATIEDLDIADLQREISLADNEDIKVLYQNLMKGSRNHMRSFVSQLEREGATYTARYISAEYLENILKINHETATITDPDYIM